MDIAPMLRIKNHAITNWPLRPDRLSAALPQPRSALGRCAALKLSNGSRRTVLCASSEGGSAEGSGVNAMELGQMQQLMLGSQDQGNDHMVCCVVLGGAVPTEAQLRNAVKALQAKHLVLRSTINLDTDGVLRLRETENSALLSGSVTESTQEWQDEAAHITNTVQFPKPTTETPTSTWRVVLTQPESSPPALILVLNHCFFDGTSRNRLLTSFLEHLRPAHADAQSSKNEVPMLDEGALMEKLDRMSWPRFVWHCMRYVGDELRFASTDWKFPLQDAPGVVDPKTERRTEQIRFSLTEPETRSLMERSRRERTTVHAALTAAAHHALAPSLQPAQSATSFGSSHLISHWRALDAHIPKDAVAGTLIGMQAGVKVNVYDTCSVWDLARQVKASLQRYQPMQPRQTKLFFRLVGAIRKLTNLISPASRNAGVSEAWRTLERGSDQFFISNLGRVELDGDYAGTQVESVFFCTPRHTSAGGVGGLHVQTVRGRMHVTWSYYSHVWADATAQAFVARFRSTLASLCA